MSQTNPWGDHRGEMRTLIFAAGVTLVKSYSTHVIISSLSFSILVDIQSVTEFMRWKEI